MTAQTSINGDRTGYVIHAVEGRFGLFDLPGSLGNQARLVSRIPSGKRPRESVRESDLSLRRSRIKDIHRVLGR